MVGGEGGDGDDDEENGEEEEDVMARGAGTGSTGGSDADRARELARYVDRFAALMERRFRGLVLGRATAATATKATGAAMAPAAVPPAGFEEWDEEEEDVDGPVVVPWEEVARALGEIEEDLGGGVGAGGASGWLSAIAEEDG